MLKLYFFYDLYSCMTQHDHYHLLPLKVVYLWVFKTKHTIQLQRHYSLCL